MTRKKRPKRSSRRRMKKTGAVIQPLKALVDQVMKPGPIAPPTAPLDPSKEPRDVIHETLVAALASDEFFEDWVAASGQNFDDSKQGGTALRETSTVRPDAVRVMYRGGRAVLSVVIEVQLRPDNGKFRAWKRYLCRVSDRDSCPAMLLVICIDPNTERWAEELLDLLPFKAPGIVLSAGNVDKLMPGCEQARALLWAAACKKAAGALPPGALSGGAAPRQRR